MMDDHKQELNMILDCNDTLKFTTQSMRTSEFNRAKYYFISFEGYIWNYSFLSVFIKKPH